MATLLIKNGRVWNGNKFEIANVHTKDGKISYIGDDERDADIVIDASQKIVSPGLVDIHTHMKNISGDNFGYEPHMFTIPFGVTSAADCSGNNGSKEILDAFTIKALAFAGTRFEGNEPDYETIERNISRYGEKCIGLKVCYDVNISRVQGIEPLRKLCDYAHQRGLKVMVHCSNSPVSMNDILSVLEKGDILTHAYHGGVNTAMEDDFKGMIEAQKRGVIIDAGMAAYVHTNFEIFSSAINAGAIPDVISTDITRNSAYIRGGCYGMTMCMTIARDLGMKEEDIFKAVTYNAAKALGKESEWGVLEVGRCADVSVFDYKSQGYDLTDKDGNHISSSNGYRCVLTVIDGNIMYRI